jgi:oligosaccharide repeat unit polymerase
VFTVGSVGVGISLSLATAIEATAGVRSLIRVDILMLWVLYGLTFFEFLFPQPKLGLSPTAAVDGTHAVLLGFAGLVVGRHLVHKRGGSRGLSAFSNVRPTYLFLLFVLVTLLGYLHIFLAVNFDPFEAVRQMGYPRFAQSWARGRYGDAYALLFEIGALIWLVPPIAGFIYARSNEYKLFQKLIVTIVLIFTFYFGFASGTRTVLVAYVITFGGGYFLARPQITLRRILILTIPTVVILFFAITYMLAFRNMGLSEFSFAEQPSDTFFVDYNIVNLSRLTEVFPDSFEFLGLEIPFNALIRPIPRVLWPGKPDGLSVSIETALGFGPAMTVSCTFVGEAYMSGGLLAVLFISILFGMAAEVWNRVRNNSNLQLAQLLYASGFLVATVAMRSMLSMVPMMLPILALWLFGKLWLPRSSLRRRSEMV